MSDSANVAPKPATGVVQALREVMWRMAAGERTAVDTLLSPVTRLLWRIGYRFDFVGGFTLSRVEDAASYQPTYAPWSKPDCRAELRVGDRRSLVSPERRYFVRQMLRHALRAVSGSVAECGVYRGGTAYVIAETIEVEAPGRVLRLFDTFAGMPPTDARHDVHREGDFADTQLSDVQNYVRNFANVTFHPGFIPDTFADLPDDRYAFVHIDLDIYRAVLDATAYFYERMTPGGIIVYDDYGLRSCPGARRAVDEFFSDKREVPTVLSSGHCFAIKLGPSVA